MEPSKKTSTNSTLFHKKYHIVSGETLYFDTHKLRIFPVSLQSTIAPTISNTVTKQKDRSGVSTGSLLPKVKPLWEFCIQSGRSIETLRSSP